MVFGWFFFFVFFVLSQTFLHVSAPWAQRGFGNNLVIELGRRAVRKSAAKLENNARVFLKTTFLYMELHVGQIFKGRPALLSGAFCPQQGV